MKIEKFQNFLEKLFFSKRLVKIIFLFNLAVLLLYLFNVSFVVIDNTTILLMLLVLITPFASHIKKIKWGDFEAELDQNIERLKEQAKDVEEVKLPGESTVGGFSKELFELAVKDKLLALAKLRIEIELRLKRLLMFLPDKRRYGIIQMVRALQANNLISIKLGSLISETAAVLNRALHSEDVLTEAKVDNVLTIGLDIISALDTILYEQLIEPVSKRKISKEELKKYFNSKYEVTTVVPLVKNPYMNKRILTQEQLDQLLEGHEEYAEFLVSIKRVKN